MAFMGGAGLWADVGYRFEEARRLCMAGFDDPSPAVRDAFAMALGEMVAACRSESAFDAVSCRRPGTCATWPHYSLLITHAARWVMTHAHSLGCEDALHAVGVARCTINLKSIPLCLAPGMCEI